MGHERVIGVKIAGLSLLFVVSGGGGGVSSPRQTRGKMPLGRQAVVAVSDRWTRNQEGKTNKANK